MQIFELTQPKKTLKEYDPSRPPPKKNFGAGVGPGVQPQYTATPQMKGAPRPGPAPQLPAPAANQLATTAPAPEIQTIAAPAQLPAPAAVKQIGTNYDPNVVDVDAREVPNTPAVPTIDNPVNPNVKPGGSKEAQAFRAQQAAQQQSQAAQSSQNTAATPPEPVPAAQPSTTQTSKVAKANSVAPAPSTPGVRGSRTGAVVSALGSRLRDKLAADAGLSGAPDTGDNNAYGDQRAAAARAAAPLINQQAREEMAKWNQAVANTVKQAGVSSPAQLPTATKQALSRSLMNQVYINFLQGKLGKEYRKLPQYVDGKVQQEAAAQVAKLDNSIKAILNFNAPVSSPEAQMQRWQDLSQSTYDMRSLLTYSPKTIEYSAGKKMPEIQTSPGGTFRIGSYTLNAQDPKDVLIGNIIKNETKNGQLPTISLSSNGQYQIGNYALNLGTGAEQKAVQIIKQQIASPTKTTAKQPTQPKQLAAPAGTTPSKPGAPAPAATAAAQTPEQIRIAKQQAAAASAQKTMTPKTPIPVAESLTWSREFDPSRTLLKKVRQL
jgi:hypothetical protein